MLNVGDSLPGATVMREDRSAATLRDLLAEGPILLVFYLFDWSST